ncbi:MAG: cupin [candidate division Zixibacteria bacterium SM23_81]|nr:MAG: cupin [candidate division Zixibacteria bacterium SM23_81]
MSQPGNKEAGQIPAGEAIDLAGLIEYASGSIVSRQLAKNDAGTMTLFAFDAGQGLSKHSTPFDAVVQILDGEAELIIGGRSVFAEAGQLVIMPADVPHAVKAPQRFKMFLTMLRAK